MKTQITYPKRPPKQPPKSVVSFADMEAHKENKDFGLWGVHDPAVYQDPITGMYYEYSTGANCQKSKDLVHWENVGKVVAGPPKEAVEWTKSRDIWAPDIIKVGDEYRLYCSNSSWGVRQSCIFMAVSKSPEGPFEPRGIVLKTTDDMSCNAIDANLIEDHSTGDLYMLYGSFWGGVYLLPLDKETGLAAEPDAEVKERLSQGEKDFITSTGYEVSCGVVLGRNLARRPKWMSAAIEGPYMIYNPITDYYYLFVSYGSLKSDYNIRVARSRTITGPFLDPKGVCMTNQEDWDNATGYLLFSGYEWNTGTAYMAPGHNSVICDAEKNWYLLCHIREKNFTGEGEISTMQVRKMFWTSDGWPVLSPEVYAGEEDLQEVTEEDLIGFYEKIEFQPMLPEGVHIALPMKLGPNHYYENASIQGTWELKNNRITIQYGDTQVEAIVTPVWDAQMDCATLAITGKTSKDHAFWAKRDGSLT